MEQALTGGRCACVLVAALLAGCSPVPILEGPAVPRPAAFKETLPASLAASWKLAEPSEALARGEWWAVFGDARLASLMTEVATANPSLQAGLARLKRSRARVSLSEADRLPQVDIGAGATRSRPSANAPGQASGAQPAARTSWRLQAGASYDVDLFGRVAAEVSAARADAQQSQALLRSLQLAIQADVAHHYFAARGLDSELALLDETVRLRQTALDLVTRRFQAGETSELDVARARTELSVTRSEAMVATRQRAELEHALAVLLGKAPAELDLPRTPLAFTPVAVPAGLPSALLERRPDIAAAEHAMAAAHARVAQARAAYFPRLSLTGSAGFESAEIGDLLRAGSRSWLLGPLVGTILSMPLFDGGRNQALQVASQASYEEVAADYVRAVLEAFREVEDGLSALRMLAEQANEQAVSVAAAQRGAELSQARYLNGLVNHLEVIDAERQLLATRRAATQVQRERALATVALIRALGGGWDSMAMLQTSSAAPGAATGTQ